MARRRRDGWTRARHCGSRLLQPLVSVMKIGTQVSCHSTAPPPPPPLSPPPSLSITPAAAAAAAAPGLGVRGAAPEPALDLPPGAGGGEGVRARGRGGGAGGRRRGGAPGGFPVWAQDAEISGKLRGRRAGPARGRAPNRPRRERARAGRRGRAGWGPGGTGREDGGGVYLGARGRRRTLRSGPGLRRGGGSRGPVTTRSLYSRARVDSYSAGVRPACPLRGFPRCFRAKSCHLKKDRKPRERSRLYFRVAPLRCLALVRARDLLARWVPPRDVGVLPVRQVLPVQVCVCLLNLSPGVQQSG